MQLIKIDAYLYIGFFMLHSFHLAILSWLLVLYFEMSPVYFVDRFLDPVFYSMPWSGAEVLD
jgi:hypothetical protein